MRPILAMLLMFSVLFAIGGTPISVFNGQAFELDSTGNYSFVVGGHFYGNSAANSGYPASSLLGGLDRIKDFDPDMLFVTGDLFLNVKHDSANYRRALFDRLPSPIYNAVGNHDLDGDFYENFEPTFQYFFIGNDLFVVLNTELDNGSIEGEQYEMLSRALIEAEERDAHNIFIFSHRPIWAIGHEDIDGLLKNNTRSLTGNNFNDDVLPLLIETQESAKVYWFSGSMGGQAPASFLYHEEDKIHLIITAIRDTRRDAVLGVTVNSGKAQFSIIPLGQSKVEPLENYNVDLWRKNGKETKKFNFRLLPYYIKTTLTHRAFWSGVVSVLILLVVVKLIRRIS